MNIKKISLALLLTSTLFMPMAYAMDNDETLGTEKKQNIVKYPFKGIQEKVYKKILEIKYGPLLVTFSQVFLEDEEYEKAFFLLQKVEKLEENFDSAFQLGYMYLEGKGVEKDEERAEEYYKKGLSLLEHSSEENDPHAVASFILMCEELGKHACKKESVEEVKLFYLRLAQLLGQLANMYDKGINVSQDSEAAMSFYEDQRNLYIKMYQGKLIHSYEEKLALLKSNNNWFRLKEKLGAK